MTLRRAAMAGRAGIALAIAFGSIAAVPTADLVAPVAGGMLARLDGPGRQGGLVRGSIDRGDGRCHVTSLRIGTVAVPVAADGRFIIGFDRDAPPLLRLSETRDCGGTAETAQADVAVAPRAWRIERLDRLARVPVPDADFAARRPAELARIAAARAAATAATGETAQGWRQSFVWPARGRISGLFGSQRIYRGEPGAYHGGVDVAKPVGAAVVAPADGVVILAADPPFTLEGRLLMIDHGMGLTSAFLHLSRIDVRVGDRGRQGQVIGAAGATGRATGPHLHWAMTWGTARIDPMPVAGPMPPG